MLQGSRLTAFELVHEQIPATLIADSAAAALMKAGRVNAVVVGADRIAANGINVQYDLNRFGSNLKVSNANVVHICLEKVEFTTHSVHIFL